MKNRITLLAALSFALVPLYAQKGAPPQQPGGAPAGEDGRPLRPHGPHLQELQSYRVGSDGTVTPLSNLEESAVASLARLADGRLVLAHQWFPMDDDTHFEHIAVRYSSDEGVSWTKPVPLEISGLADGQRQPFGPTLVPLPDGRMRLYYIARALDSQGPGGATIGSAISSDGLHFAIEPGTRFTADGLGLIDCTVALHAGVFHLFAPEIDFSASGRPPRREGPEPGAGGKAAHSGSAPGAAPEGGGRERPHAPKAFHATSSDGLNFTRGEDVELEGVGRWMGAAVSDGGKLCYFGTGGLRAPGEHKRGGDAGAPPKGGTPPAGGAPSAHEGPSAQRGGVWFATSSDGVQWSAQPLGSIPLGDPAAVRLRDGSWLVIGSAGGRNGPPMRGGPPQEGEKPVEKPGGKPAEKPAAGG